MESFKISFWNLPLSKDDSFIGLPQAELIHAAVTKVEAAVNVVYTVEPLDEVWKQQLGIIEISKTPDEHWRLLTGNELAEGIFPRIIQAIEDVESTIEDQPQEMET